MMQSIDAITLDDDDEIQIVSESGPSFRGGSSQTPANVVNENEEDQLNIDDDEDEVMVVKEDGPRFFKGGGDGRVLRPMQPTTGASSAKPKSKWTVVPPPTRLGQPEPYAKRDDEFGRDVEFRNDAEVENAGRSRNAMDDLFQMNEMHSDASQEAPTPVELQVKLMQHQKKALAWMVKREGRKTVAAPYRDRLCRGGILADDQGLGKTITTISLMYSNPPEEEKRWKTLIVCPKSLVDQWKLELERRVHPDEVKKIHVYHGSKRTKDMQKLKKFDIVITTYGTLRATYPKTLPRNDPKYLYAMQNDKEKPTREEGLLYQTQWYRVILDEAVRNQRTDGWKSVMCLRAAITWCLTGTPVQNTVDDIYALLKFIKYRITFTDQEWKRNWKPRLESKDVKRRTLAMKQFQAIVGVVMLRRTKFDKVDGEPILNLPPRVTHMLKEEFRNEHEKEKYKELLNKSVVAFNNILNTGTVRENLQVVLLWFLRLRQVCVHPFLIDYCGYLKNLRNDKKVAGRKKKRKCRLDNPRASEDECDDEGVPDSDDEDFIDDRPEDEIALEAEQSVDEYEVDGIVTDEDDIHVTKGHRQTKSPNEGTASVFDSDVEVVEVVDSPVQSPTQQLSKLDLGGHNVFDDDDHMGHSSRAERKGRSLTEKDYVDVDIDVAVKSEFRRKLSQDIEDGVMMRSTKITVLVEKLRETEKRDSSIKTLIFSQWTSCLDIIQCHLEEQGISCCRLDGGLSIDERAKEIARFEKPANRVFLISLMAGGEGLNLVMASQVFLVDAWWNPAVEEQAIDRAHRIGQTRQVDIYRFCMRNTFENHVYAISDRKNAIIAGALGAEGASQHTGGRQKLTMDNILQLFRGAAAELVEGGADAAGMAAAQNILNKTGS